MNTLHQVRCQGCGQWVTECVVTPTLELLVFCKECAWIMGEWGTRVRKMNWEDVCLDAQAAAPPTHVVS